jgi:hypothetical protein
MFVAFGATLVTALAAADFVADALAALPSFLSIFIQVAPSFAGVLRSLSGLALSGRPGPAPIPFRAKKKQKVRGQPLSGLPAHSQNPAVGGLAA